MRKKMISPPKIISSMQARRSDLSAVPKDLANWLIKMGSRVINPPPKKEPRTLPIPPIMIIPRRWKETIRLKASILAAP
jgi:hypothetical protein